MADAVGEALQMDPIGDLIPPALELARREALAAEIETARAQGIG